MRVMQWMMFAVKSSVNTVALDCARQGGGEEERLCIWAILQQSDLRVIPLVSVGI